GFGGLRREEVAGRLQDLTQKAGAAPSFWEEVRRNAPRAEKSRARGSAWKRLPVARLTIGAAVGLSLLVGVLAWLHPAAKPALVADALDLERKAARGFLIDVNGMPGDCPAGDRTSYLALARKPEVSAVTLMCLAREKDGTTAESYLNGTPIDDPDRDRRARHVRNAVSLMVALGEDAVDPLCNHLFDPRDDVRQVAAQSLAYMASPRATACLTAALRADGAGTRASVTSVLKTLLARDQLPAPREDPVPRPAAGRHRLSQGRIHLLLPARHLPAAEPAADGGAAPAPALTPSRQAAGGADQDRRDETLAAGAEGLDPADDRHPLDHAAEGREALAVGIAFSPVVERRLVADADEEVAGGRIGAVAGHGDRAV